MVYFDLIKKYISLKSSSSGKIVFVRNLKNVMPLLCFHFENISSYFAKYVSNVPLSSALISALSFLENGILDRLSLVLLEKRTVSLSASSFAMGYF